MHWCNKQIAHINTPSRCFYPLKTQTWLPERNFFGPPPGLKIVLKKATYTNDTHLSMRIFQALTRNHNGTHMTGTHPTRTHRTHPAAHTYPTCTHLASQWYSSHPDGKHLTSTHPAGTHPAHTHPTRTHRTGTKSIRSFTPRAARNCRPLCLPRSSRHEEDG